MTIWFFLSMFAFPILISLVVIWVIDAAEVGAACPWNWCGRLNNWLKRRRQ